MDVKIVEDTNSKEIRKNFTRGISLILSLYLTAGLTKNYIDVHSRQEAPKKKEETSITNYFVASRGSDELSEMINSCYITSQRNRFS